MKIVDRDHRPQFRDPSGRRDARGSGQQSCQVIEAYLGKGEI